MAEIAESSPGRYVLSGLINLESVVSLREEGFQFIDSSHDDLVIDISKVESRGSAFLALLLSWVGYASQKNLAILFVNADERLQRIAEVSGVRELIHID